MTHVTEAEFLRSVKLGMFSRFFLKESSTDKLKFWIAAFEPKHGIVYTIKHRRENKIRQWRLDNAAKFLTKAGVYKFEVACNQ